MKQGRNTAGTLTITGGDTAAVRRCVLRAENAAARAAGSAAAAEEAALHFPVPGDNGNWQIWDAQTGGFTDSGKNCSGSAGASAYELAAAGGYEGTEEQFQDDLAHLKDYAQEAEYARADAIAAANAAGGYSSQARQAIGQAQSAMNAAQRAADSAAASAAAAQAAVVNAADNGSVGETGLISFRHGTTELFTVQLPLYDGSVTYGP